MKHKMLLRAATRLRVAKKIMEVVVTVETTAHLALVPMEMVVIRLETEILIAQLVNLVATIIMAKMIPVQDKITQIEVDQNLNKKNLRMINLKANCQRKLLISSNNGS